jgi:hypothetical protein
MYIDIASPCSSESKFRAYREDINTVAWVFLGLWIFPALNTPVGVHETVHLTVYDSRISTRS